jgi:hypothetical protein
MEPGMSDNIIEPAEMSSAEIVEQLRLRASRMCCDGYFSFDAQLDNEAAHYLDQMEAALILALPYVETAESDDAYKPGAVRRITKTIRAALAKAVQP